MRRPARCACARRVGRLPLRPLGHERHAAVAAAGGARPRGRGHRRCGRRRRRNLKAGDHIVVSWVPQCGKCYTCSTTRARSARPAPSRPWRWWPARHDVRASRSRARRSPDGGLGHVLRGAVIPEIGAVKVDADDPDHAAALIGCGVLTGFGAAANTAEHPQGRHRCGHRLRWCRPQRDPGREAEGRGADHRRRHGRLEARQGQAVRCDRSRQRRRRRPGGGRSWGSASGRGVGRRRSRSSGSRPDDRADVRDGPARWPGDHRRRAGLRRDVDDHARHGHALPGEAGPGQLVRRLERPPRRAEARQALHGGHAAARRAHLPGDPARRGQRGARDHGQRRDRPLRHQVQLLEGALRYRRVRHE